MFNGENVDRRLDLEVYTLFLTDPYALRMANGVIVCRQKRLTWWPPTDQLIASPIKILPFVWSKWFNGIAPKSPELSASRCPLIENCSTNPTTIPGLAKKRHCLKPHVPPVTLAILLDEYNQSHPIMFKPWSPQLQSLLQNPKKTSRTITNVHGLIPFSVALSRYSRPHSQLSAVASAATVTASPATVPAASTASRSWMAKNQRRPRCNADRVLGDAVWRSGRSWVEV